MNLNYSKYEFTLDVWKITAEESLIPGSVPTCRTAISKQWRKHYNQIVFHLYCVNKGYKQSFLWDIGPILHVDTLRKLIEDLKHASLLNPHIYLVLIEEQKFVVNIETLLWYIENFLNEIKFVNCSYKLDKPVVMHCDVCKEAFSFHSVKEKISDILKSQTNTKQDVILTLDFDENIMRCPPTIYGILIGYPVIYWDADILNSSTSNCLINTLLDVYKIRINDTSISMINKDYNLYSFSVPACLDLDAFVNSWVDILNKRKDIEYLLFKSTVHNLIVQL